MHSLNITPRTRQNAVIFDVSGEIDMSNIDWMKETIQTWIDGGHRDLILNLSQVRYMDSSGLSLLVSLKRKLDSQGSISLVGCPQIVQRMMAVTRLNTLFMAYEDEEDALQAVIVVGTGENSLTCSVQ